MLIRQLDPNHNYICHSVALKNGDPCVITVASSEAHSQEIFDLHERVRQDHQSDCFIYPKSMDEIDNLIHKDGRTLIMTHLPTMKIIAKRSFNMNPSDDDLPLLNRGKLERPIAVGADTTHPDFQGQGAMGLLSAAMVKMFEKRVDVYDVVSVVTVGNAPSLANYLRSGIGFRMRAMGTDPVDGSRIMVCHRNFQSQPELVAGSEYILPAAMKYDGMMAQMLGQGLIGCSLKKNGQMVFCLEKGGENDRQPVRPVSARLMKGDTSYVFTEGRSVV